MWFRLIHYYPEIYTRIELSTCGLILDYSCETIRPFNFFNIADRHTRVRTPPCISLWRNLKPPTTRTSNIGHKQLLNKHKTKLIEAEYFVNKLHSITLNPHPKFV